MVYSGQAPPERGTFSRIHSVYERVEILLVELYFSSLKRLKEANRLIYLHGCEVVDKSFCFFILFIF